ncbi:MAG TPA: host attachment protein [Caldimonas sp.]|jgi:CBS domain-containing protein/protein required for attachment to host cells|nr:host attachment protein [Caldimonas sp.]HEX2543078.1 host attachment protein [Caldimonas sp.]
MTQVSEVMTRGVRTLSPRDSMVSAAQAMQELDIGVVPVCEGDRLVGMVTDRDIVVRGIAHGRVPETTPLEEVMSREPRSCFEDQSVDDVLEQMRDARVRRVPVLDRQQHLVGMLSLGDVATKADGDGAGIVLQEVSEPSQPQGADALAGPDAATGDDADAAPEPVTGDEGRAPRAVEARAEAVARGDEIRADGGGRIDDDRSGHGRWAERGVTPRTDNKTIWVVVADEAIAKILRWPETGDELEHVEALTDPAAHARESDFDRDAQGRRAGAAPQGSRQNTPQHRLRSSANVTASAGQDDQHLEAQGFARRVAQHLAEALRQKKFDELRIVAAPRFLGHLRKELDPHVSATVSEEINKDLIHYGNGELTRRLFPRAGEGDDAAS